MFVKHLLRCLQEVILVFKKLKHSIRNKWLCITVATILACVLVLLLSPAALFLLTLSDALWLKAIVCVSLFLIGNYAADKLYAFLLVPDLVEELEEYEEFA